VRVDFILRQIDRLRPLLVASLALRVITEVTTQTTNGNRKIDANEDLLKHLLAIQCNNK
jgi:hypothetical protein